MASDVYFASSRCVGNRSVLEAVPLLMEEAGLEFVKGGDLVAVKVHVGEPGATRFLRPQFAKAAVDVLKGKGAKPFLTDSNTLYRGHRDNAVNHMLAAAAHGFDSHGTGAPFIVADGLTSKELAEVTVDLNHFKVVRYGAAAHHARSIMVLSHFKAHLVASFGGALKNVSMGLGGRAAKQQMHGNVKPAYEDSSLCDRCGTCASVCPAGAVQAGEDLMRFDWNLCEGCGDCIVHCPQGALRIQWDERPEILGEKMAEVALAVLKNKRGRALFLNFVMDVTPDCDCVPWSDHPVVPDVGILASRDPVAIDAASADLVNVGLGLSNTRLRKAHEPGSDKLRDLRPAIDWTRQLDYAESIGLGSRSYRLTDIYRKRVISPEEALQPPVPIRGFEEGEGH
jgi:uncharacterized Fe-S center protein